MRAAHAFGVQETHEDVDQLVVRSRPGAWFETEGHIIDKAGVELDEKKREEEKKHELKLAEQKVKAELAQNLRHHLF